MLWWLWGPDPPIFPAIVHPANSPFDSPHFRQSFGCKDYRVLVCTCMCLCVLVSMRRQLLDVLGSVRVHSPCSGWAGAVKTERGLLYFSSLSPQSINLDFSSPGLLCSSHCSPAWLARDCPRCCPGWTWSCSPCCSPAPACSPCCSRAH